MPTMTRPYYRVVALTVLVILAACGGGPPTVKIVGGGFIFNYRIAEAYYGIVAEVGGAIPEGALLEAGFENPDAADPIVIRQAIIGNRPRYKFETPALKGIEADRPYRVTLSLLSASGEPLAEAERSFRSKVGQEILPERPLSVGPGYHRPQDQTIDDHRQ